MSCEVYSPITLPERSECFGGEPAQILQPHGAGDVGRWRSEPAALHRLAAVRASLVLRPPRQRTTVPDDRRRLMITTPTVFVVGAGGSQPYGLPASSTLADSARRLVPGAAVFQLLHTCLGDLELLQRLLADFKQHSLADSIDAYLQHRQHLPDIMRAGKALIAALMGEAILEAQN